MFDLFPHHPFGDPFSTSLSMTFICTLTAYVKKEAENSNSSVLKHFLTSSAWEMLTFFFILLAIEASGPGITLSVDQTKWPLCSFGHWWGPFFSHLLAIQFAWRRRISSQIQKANDLLFTCVCVCACVCVYLRVNLCLCAVCLYEL